MSPREKKSPQFAIDLTERAISDLQEIERCSVKHRGRKTAGKYLDEMAAALDRLRQNPELLRLEPDLAPGLYFYRVKKHFLVCSWRDQRIIVLTVIQTTMDLPTRLLELELRLATEAELLQKTLQCKTTD